MLTAVIHYNPGGPVPIGFAEASGMPGDFRFDFKTQSNVPFTGVVDWFPQLVMRPFTRSGAFGYDIVIDDPTGASGIAKVPGSVMDDVFHLEVYVRNSEGQPQAMIAYGRHDLTGYGYKQSSYLSPATYEVGPAGPAGPQGATGVQGLPGDPGERGSRWYTGAGAPGMLPDDRVDGDMYLDETNGDVWRWSVTARAWVPFKGV
jgi:hypothetical protein